MGHGGDFQIVQVKVPDKLIATSFSKEKLDNVGAGVYIENAELNKAKIKKKGLNVLLVESRNVKKLCSNVKVYWMNADKSNLPLNMPYYVITGADGVSINSETAWSLVILAYQHDYENNKMISFAKAHFLVSDAPHSLLREGNKLNIYEGSKLVGVVEVISTE